VFISEGLRGPGRRHVVLVAAEFGDLCAVEDAVNGLRSSVLNNPFISRQRGSARVRSLAFNEAHPETRRQMRAVLSRLQFVSDVRFASTGNAGYIDEKTWYRSALKQFVAGKLVRWSPCEVHLCSESLIDIATATRDVASLEKTFVSRERTARSSPVAVGELVRVRLAEHNDACCLAAEHMAGTIHQALEADASAAVVAQEAYREIASHVRIIRDVGEATTYRGHTFLAELNRRL
jgi:hypothetical protein